MAANTNTLSLRSVLEKDKLNSLNFLDWFRNLRIVLKQEQKLYVIEQPLPNEPPTNASRADRDAYKKHLNDMVDVGCLMLAIMNPEIQKQHENMVAYDMIEHLKELYQGQARQEMFDISKALFQCKLAEGSPVGTHVLKMIGYIESLSKLGFSLSQGLATNVILQLLPDSYSQFVLNFNMNEIDKTLPQLLSNMKKVGPKPILMVHNNKGKGKAKVQTKPKGKGRPNPGKGKATLKPKGGVSKERNCFHCGVIGHWKRNCPVYLEEIKKAKGLQRSWTLARGDVDLQVRNGVRVAALAVGTYTLSLPSGLDLCLEDCYFARGGFHYFITFTDDFSRYGYVHKSEALEKFKEFKNEECGIVSQLTPLGTPQWNGVSERRNRTLLDMVRSMMSHADLPTSFWGHPRETVAFTLNHVPSKSVQKMPCEIWTGKRPNQDEPRTYQEAVTSPDSEKWLEAMRFEMDSMYENQMDIKTAFLNGKLEEDQACRSWNLRFNNAIKEFGFIKNEDEPCVYKEVSGSTITFLVLYVDDILIMGNDIPTLQSIKTWLGSCFSMKDLGEATYILGVRIYRDRSRQLLGLSQSTYIDKVLKRFNMEESKRRFLPMRHGISLSKEMYPSTPQERERMSKIPYASSIGSIMYAMLCTCPNISYALSLTSWYQVDPGEGHWTTIKNILKYLRRTKDTLLIYGGEEELSVKGYTDASFQTDKDDSRSQSGFVFCLNGGAVSWKSSKQSTVADSTTEAEYTAARVVPSISDAIELRCDNNGAIAQAKEPRSHQRSKHILRRYHLILEIAEYLQMITLLTL
ncbi:hypothetical protein CXB51_003177 [Gossypium anomalum]|uniref:CCHC-type domain-containing protein n=1 Tax=Gossypium anomalum TaxID=47600 RepID=A0A8J6DDP0_9ROSI|nr:hypothetical protein CXB51_003177 [Gossypium anomalum]